MEGAAKAKDVKDVKEDLIPSECLIGLDRVKRVKLLYQIRISYTHWVFADN